MRYMGRNIDPIKVWEDFVEFPHNMSVDENTMFLPLVRCPNPDHDTEKRHFQINVEKPLVHCFANCGISGTYEHALSVVTGETHRAVRKRILKHSRIGPVRKKRRATGGSAAVISPSDLRYETYLPPAALEYLASRGISGATISQWELGWDAEKLRIVIPVRDSKGRLVFLIKRAIKEKDHPKYLYTEGVDKSRVIYGAGQMNPGMVRSWGMVVVEGSIDTMAMHQDGFQTTGGILGSKLSEFQARIIANKRPKRVYTMFDADAAGVGATISVTAVLRTVPIYVCLYPKGKTDPAELTATEKRRAIERAIPAAEFHKRAGIARKRNRTQREPSFG